MVTARSKTLMEQYREKLVAADEAARMVKSGDWIHIGQFAMQYGIVNMKGKSIYRAICPALKNYCFAGYAI